MFILLAIIQQQTVGVLVPFDHRLVEMQVHCNAAQCFAFSDRSAVHILLCHHIFVVNFLRVLQIDTIELRECSIWQILEPR